MCVSVCVRACMCVVTSYTYMYNFIWYWCRHSTPLAGVCNYAVTWSMLYTYVDSMLYALCFTLLYAVHCTIYSMLLYLQILLKLTQSLFEDTTCLEVVMTKVMEKSLELIPSESCTVMLLDMDCKEVCTSNPLPSTWEYCVYHCRRSNSVDHFTLTTPNWWRGVSPASSNTCTNLFCFPSIRQQLQQLVTTVVVVNSFLFLVFQIMPCWLSAWFGSCSTSG